ncbi:hypothetical protein SAY87_013131 [Trapa incisa]|nr:hypothetical protein SAY87_013131 [Trapa incisa]
MMMKTGTRPPPLIYGILALAVLSRWAMTDPDPLQDYCIANTTSSSSSMTMNEIPCINPASATASHFATSALSKPGNTGNRFGFNVTLANTANLPGLNTMGLTLARVDIAPQGVVPPHSHPRASEVTTCLKGYIHVGFVDASNRLYTQILRPGDSFVFPRGLIHYLYNSDYRTPALAMSGLNSQNPGTQIASLATFASNPEIPEQVLEKAFKITGQDIARIHNNLGG